MLTNRDVILAKIEGTYNTDSVPVAADDAILVESPNWGMEGLRMVDRPVVSATIDTRQRVYAGSLKSVSFDMEIKGAGAAYAAATRPEIDVLLRACGFSSTVDAGVGTETVTYVPVSTGHESITIYYYQDGTRHILTGCRGVVSFNLETGSIPKASFTFTGHFVAMTDTAMISPTYDSTVPPAVINGAFTVDGFAAVIASLAWDMGNTLATPPDFNASDGYGPVQITKRDVTGSFDPEAVVVASEAFEANFLAGTTMALVTGDIGGTQYNQFNVAMPALYYQSMGPGDRDGVRTYDMGCAMAASSGDDEVTIVFD
ncbi:MAG: hypothetical protein JRC86_02975 [Deltaproteobacteria bacterium]|nr:hypothetical protein [Deltaproteobacteria bacterium]